VIIGSVKTWGDTLNFIVDCRDTCRIQSTWHVFYERLVFLIKCIYRILSSISIFKLFKTSVEVDRRRKKGFDTKPRNVLSSQTFSDE
jgi:hypothetical protein